MKRFLTVLVAVCTACCLQAANPNAAKEVSFSLLKTAPEKHKGRLVTYSEVFRDFANTFPPYMEMAGFKSTRWLLLTIGDLKLPVLIKKKDDVTAMVADLKPGTMVIVTGRIREFKVDPKMPAYAKYYVDADTIVPVPGAPVQPAQPVQGMAPVRPQPQPQPQPQNAVRQVPVQKGAEPPPF